MIENLNKFNLLNKRKFDFQPGHSTTDEVLTILDDIYECLNNKKHTWSVFVNFRRTFNLQISVVRFTFHISVITKYYYQSYMIMDLEE